MEFEELRKELQDKQNEVVDVHAQMHEVQKELKEMNELVGTYVAL